MPKEENNNGQDEVEVLRQQLAQREAELQIALKNNHDLEELVLSGPMFAKAADDANKNTNNGNGTDGKGKETNEMSDGKTIDVQKLTETVVNTATTVAENAVKEAKWKADQKSVAETLYKTDPKFKLYIEEIKQISMANPTLSVAQAYTLAKEANPNKQPTPERVDTGKRDVGRIKSAKEPHAGERFSGVSKVKNFDEREQAHEEAFDTAIEAGLEASGLQF